MEIHNALENKELLQDDGDDESTAGNFKVVARERYLSPRITEKHGNKGKKQTENKEQQPPTRILPKRAASTTR